MSQPGQRVATQWATRWDGHVIVTALLLVSGLSWYYLAFVAPEPMGAGVLTWSGLGDAGSTMGADPMMGGGSGMAVAVFLGMWTVMMVAMMFPATAPMVMLFDRWRRSRRRSPVATIGFVVGYLTVWSLAGLLAYVVLLAVRPQVMSPTAAGLVGGATLVGAGLYQLGPLKNICLRNCRSPLSFMMTHGQRLGRGVRGPLRVGIVHGAYCLGCCWALMAVLLMLGLMHLGWMAAVSALILLEKLLPAGRRVAQVAGVGLTAAGVIVLAAGVAGAAV